MRLHCLIPLRPCLLVLWLSWLLGRAEANRAPRPSDAPTAAQQAVSSLLINLPLAASVGLSFPAAANASSNSIAVTAELAASLAAGQQLWQQQASRADKLQCSPFNGPVELLRNAASPIVGAQSQLLQQSPSPAQLAAARDAFAAMAKSVAMQAAAAARSGPQASSSRLDPFRQAILFPGSTEQTNRNGVLPPPAADATAEVSWDGGDVMAAAVLPGPGMGPAAVRTAVEALQDGIGSMAAWVNLKVG
jgi:hypothetical protein